MPEIQGSAYDNISKHIDENGHDDKVKTMRLSPYCTKTDI